jgi:predicted metal-dependent peptidase
VQELIKIVGPSTLDLTTLPLPNSIGRLLGGMPQLNITGPYVAGLALDNEGRYSLLLNHEKLADYTTVQKVWVIIHEITHLAHGHIPYCVMNKLNPMLWNIATDAWINRAWPDALVDPLQWVTYTALQKQIPELPSMLLSPRILYDWLNHEQQAHLKQLLESLIAQDSLQTPSELSDSSKANATIEQIQTIRAIREAMADPNVPQSVKDELDRLLHGASMTGGERAYTKGGKSIIPCEWLSEVLARLRGHSIHGDYRRTRGWYRPGRADHVAGSRKSYGPLVLVAIDVSGSTCNYWPGFIAAAAQLSGLYRLQVVVYADKILFSGPTLPMSATKTGGGTNFNPAFRHADNIKAHLMVNITDGENADTGAKLPKCPVAWVYVPNSTKHSLRPGDMELNVV